MLKNWSIVVLGMLLFVLYNFASANLDVSKNPNLFYWYGFIEASLIPLGTIIFSIGIINLIAPSFMRVVWHELINPKIDSSMVEIRKLLDGISAETRSNLAAISDSAEKHLVSIDNNVQDNLGRMTDSISNAGKTLEEFASNNGKNLPLVECVTHDEFCKHMDAAAKGAFGPKTNNPDSFYSFVKDRLLESCCQKPYRHRVRKRIKLKQNRDFDNYVDWHETTEFKLHHIMWPENKVSASYKLEITISSFAPDFNLEDYHKHASLIIAVDSQRKLHSDAKPKYEENISDYGFYCWRSGDWIKLRYKKELKLKQEWTDVFIEENSINSKDDMLYSVHTAKPIFGHVVEFELADGFAFIGHPYLSNSIMVSGLPDHMDKEHIRKMISVNKNSERSISVKIDDWILPGIMMDFNWRKISG